MKRRIMIVGAGFGQLIAIQTAKEMGLEYMEADVHVNHYQMHRVYAGHGFKIYASFYTFHKWL